MTTEYICHCVVGLHEECIDPQDHEIEGFITCCCWSAIEVEASNPGAIILGGYKDNASVGDVTSTGRKRAAVLYPIEDGMTCEWAHLKFAGGGVIPIIGCRGTRLSAEKGHGSSTGMIHHGPDKNTLNNERNNVHRICATCHNRWHTLNDTFYGDRPPSGEPFIPLDNDSKPHNPEILADDGDQFKSEIYWATTRSERPNYIEHTA